MKTSCCGVAKPGSQLGVTIVEVMVSIAVGLFILAGVMQLYASATQNSSVVAASSTIQENARYIFSRFAEDVSQAGFGGCFNLTSVTAATGTRRFTSVVAGDNAEGELYDFDHYIFGSNDNALEDMAFDAFTVRYAKSSERHEATAHTPPTFQFTDSSSFEPGDVVLATNCSRMAMFKVSSVTNATDDADGSLSYDLQSGNTTYNTSTYLGAPFDVVTDVNQRKSGVPPVFLSRATMGVVEYHISTSAAGTAAAATCSSNNPQYCALFRRTTTANIGDELVEGVQAFEVEYGWQDYNDEDRLHFVAADQVGVNWELVDRVKVSATLNSIEKAPTNDGAQRIERTYSRVFLVRNQFPGDRQFRQEAVEEVVAGG